VRKQNQIHTLVAPHYKTHFRFFEKIEGFSAPYGPKNTVSIKYMFKEFSIFKQAAHLQKTILSQ